MNVLRPRREVSVLPNTTFEDFSKEKDLTIPDQAISPQEALERFSSKTLEETIRTYYEDEAGLASHADFQKMDKLERLMALADYREHVKELRQKADEASTPPKEEIPEPTPTGLLQDIKTLLTPKSKSE